MQYIWNILIKKIETLAVTAELMNPQRTKLLSWPNFSICWKIRKKTKVS